MYRVMCSVMDHVSLREILYYNVSLPTIPKHTMTVDINIRQAPRPYLSPEKPGTPHTLALSCPRPREQSPMYLGSPHAQRHCRCCRRYRSLPNLPQLAANPRASATPAWRRPMKERSLRRKKGGQLLALWCSLRGPALLMARGALGSGDMFAPFASSQARMTLLRTGDSMMTPASLSRAPTLRQEAVGSRFRIACLALPVFKASLALLVSRMFNPDFGSHVRRFGRRPVLRWN